MKTSVILSTKNRINEVIRFCESLYNQIELSDEFIIVDSSNEPINSQKRFVDFLEKIGNKTDFRYIYSKCSLPKARNIGIKKATGNIIYFFDDDVILEPDYLQIMNKTYKDNPDYMGGMGTITGISRLSFKGKLFNAFRSFFLLPHDYGNGQFQKSGFAKYPYGTDEFKEVEVLGGCVMSYRKEIFKEFNFDEKMTNYAYMEDVDFSRRVSYKYRLFYNPEAKVEHRHGEGGRGNIRYNRRVHMFYHRYLFIKNFYSKNKLFIIAHWWSILGLIIYSLVFESKEAVKGYLDGLREFRKKKKLLWN